LLTKIASLGDEAMTFLRSNPMPQREGVKAMAAALPLTTVFKHNRPFQ